MRAVIWPVQVVTGHFYSDSEATAQYEQFLNVTNRSILTHLLTKLSK